MTRTILGADTPTWFELKIIDGLDAAGSFMNLVSYCLPMRKTGVYTI